MNCIARYVRQNGIRHIYIRSDHNTTPFLINLLQKLKKMGCKIVMEIPTYPYDQEYQGLSFGYQRVIFMDKCLRHLMAKYIDKIVTFSNHKTIFGRPTIRIANGIDFNAVPLKTNLHPKDDKLHLVAVATIHPCGMGLTAAIRGIAHHPYPPESVVLHIVGEGLCPLLWMGIIN